MLSGYKKGMDGATRASWPTPLINAFVGDTYKSLNQLTLLINLLKYIYYYAVIAR